MNSVVTSGRYQQIVPFQVPLEETAPTLKCDSAQDMVMEFALAGFSRSELSIDVQPERRSITVSAQSSDEGEAQNSRRIARRSFTKTYVNYDDNLDLNLAEARFENGLLTVTVPARPEIQPLNIEIQ